MPSHRKRKTVSELQRRNKPLWWSSLRHHATSVAQHVDMGQPNEASRTTPRGAARRLAAWTQHHHDAPRTGPWATTDPRGLTITFALPTRRDRVRECAHSSGMPVSAGALTDAEEDGEQLCAAQQLQAVEELTRIKVEAEAAAAAHAADRERLHQELARIRKEMTAKEADAKQQIQVLKAEIDLLRREARSCSHRAAIPALTGGDDPKARQPRRPAWSWQAANGIDSACSSLVCWQDDDTFWTAVKGDDARTVAQLVTSRRLSLTDWLGSQPLQWACRRGRLEVVAVLVSAANSMDDPKARGRRPLCELLGGRGGCASYPPRGERFAPSLMVVHVRW